MQILENTALLPYNTFGIASSAAYFATFSSIDELEYALDFRNKQVQELPLLILGGGSNILFTSNRVNALVLKNELMGIELVHEDADYNYVKANAGEKWHSLVEYCIQHNYAGLENLSLIPGSVGASPMQNIGAYGVELKDVFHQLEAYHIHDKTIVSFGLNDCAFGYRESVFKHSLKGQFVILNVTYKLSKQPTLNTSYGSIGAELEKMGITAPSIQSISQAVINIRTSKLPNPKVIGNAGSFFKNPQVDIALWKQLVAAFPNLVSYPVDEHHYKLAAGWLIEQCGWKGFRKNDAGCHEKQALVLVNYGNAAGNEILELSSNIIASVKHKFGVELEREVNII